MSRTEDFVDRDQAGADEGAGIDTGIGRAHHPAVQHAGNADVVNINQFAGGLGGKIDPRHRLPDDAVGAHGFHRGIVGEFEPNDLRADQFAIADAAIVAAADQAILDGKIGDGELEPFRRAREQKLSRLRRRLAQGHRRDLDGFAGDGGALVGNERRVAEHHDDARKGDIELFRHDLAERGADSRAEIDVTVVGGHRSVGADPDEGLEQAVLLRTSAAGD